MKKETHRSYAAKLKDWRWLSFSEAIKKERGNICEYCESEEKLQVHHLGYREGAEPWDYELNEVMVVCDNCHSEIHDFADRLWNEVLKCRNKWVIYSCAKAVRETIAHNEYKPIHDYDDV